MPGGHTNQQDKTQTARGKTEEKPKRLNCAGEVLKGEVLKGEVLKGEVLKGKTRQRLTRPGRLRAWSGSKLPEANVPLRALEDSLQKRMSFLLGCVLYDLVDRKCTFQ